MPIAPKDFALASDLPKPRSPIGHLKLEFDQDEGGRDEPYRDLSACAVAGSALFVAGDESHAIERLMPQGDETLTNHRCFRLEDYLDFDDPDEELDIEGLAFEGGWLWITGSHARTRPDPADDGSEPGRIDISRLADLKDTRPRCVLARIPLIEDDSGSLIPAKKGPQGRAGLVRQNKTSGSKLARQLIADPLIGPSTRLAAKEGGLDIEAIAVAGDRVALGLRGPVLQSYAVLLEPQIAPKKSGKLHLTGKPFKRMVDLDGLGIRDLCADGDDLLILAGPTQDIDGRCGVYRWKGWRSDPPQDEEMVRLHRPERLFDLPIKCGHDHPEAIEIWPSADGAQHLLVLYDSPVPDRFDGKAGSILGDLFEI